MLLLLLLLLLPNYCYPMKAQFKPTTYNTLDFTILESLITQKIHKDTVQCFENVHGLGNSQTAHESHIDINIKLPQTASPARVYQMFLHALPFFHCVARDPSTPGYPARIVFVRIVRMILPCRMRVVFKPL